MSLITLFIVLQNGILIEKVHFSSVKVDELYIKWNEKLSVEADLIKISTKKNEEQTSFDVTTIQKILQNTKLFIKWFEKIAINNIHVNGINGSFYYANDEKGYLNLASPSFDVNSTLQLLNNKLHVKLHPFQVQNFDTNISGIVTLDITKKILHSDLVSHIGNDASLLIDLNATTDAIYYNITSAKPIKSLLKLINRFELDPIIKFWAIENIKADQIDLEYLKGVYRFKEPEKFITELDAKARGKKLAYSFSKKLAPLKTQYTDVHFKDAVLHIKPYKGMFKHHKLPKGHLDIDFSQKQFHLFAYIITNTVLDSAILKILDTFGIDLPLKQTSGTTDANLKLDINLHTLDTQADGIFKVKEGDFLFKGETLHVKNGNIHLLGTHVTVNRAVISYGSYIDADVKGFLDPVKNRADLRISPKRIGIEDIILDQSHLKLHARYRLNSKNETLTLSESQWHYKHKTIILDAFKAPFRFNDFHVTLPNIGVKMDDSLQANLSGKLDISKLDANINMAINHLNYQNFKLLNTPLKLNFKYNNRELLIQTETFNTFKYDIQNIKIAPLKLSLKNNHLKILKSKFYVEDRIDFQLKGEYFLTSESGTFNLDYIQTYPQDLYSSTEALTFKYKKLDGNGVISCNKLGIGAHLTPTRWQVSLSNFEKIAPYSTLLKKNFITNGKMTIYATENNKTIQFHGEVDYPYNILIENDMPQNLYSINGVYENNVTTFRINNNIHVKIADKTTVEAKDIGFNIPSFVEFLEAQKAAESTAHHLTLNVNNSFLYISPERRVLIDTMTLNKYKQHIDATLTHHKGRAVLNYENEQFHLTGNNFDDLFMNNLLALAEHKHGSLYFYMYGKADKFQGILKVNDTILKDYKVINNMLAFVNTVPALSTFSLPQYSSKGLRVKEAYGGFSYEQKNIAIHDASLDSKELKMYGKGTLNFAKNSIDMKLNLKTDLGTTLSKIPIVGYLLFGDDGSVSTTVTINGKLDNPKVSNAVAKDIIVSPFKLLKRAILLPIHFIENVKEAPDSH